MSKVNKWQDMNGWTCSKCETKELKGGCFVPGDKNMFMALCKTCYKKIYAPESSTQKQFFGMKAEVNDGILTMENGQSFDLSQHKEDMIF